MALASCTAAHSGVCRCQRACPLPLERTMRTVTQVVAVLATTLCLSSQFASCTETSCSVRATTQRLPVAVARSPSHKPGVKHAHTEEQDYTERAFGIKGPCVRCADHKHPDPVCQSRCCMLRAIVCVLIRSPKQLQLHVCSCA